MTQQSTPAAPSPNAPLSPEIERIRKLVAVVDGPPQALAGDARTAALDELEATECWAPFFRLIKRSLEDVQNRQVADYVRLAKVQNLYLEDTFAASDTCAALTSDMRLSYKRLCEEVLPRVVEFEDFTAEATILSAVSERFHGAEDRIACLERLCMLYEKKTHSEQQLNRTYEKLLEIDPRNVKALRYFKLVFTQNNEWEEVVGILKTLLDCVTHPQELFRVAQELAAILLYQLDMAEESIQVLETYCAESPLDTSTILFDAYQRLSDWHGCLRVLRQCLLTVDEDISRAVLHLKIASILEQLDDLDGALENFVKAAKLWPSFLDAVEGIINIGVARKDFQLVRTWLDVLAERVTDERLGAQLRQASRRLQDGLEHAGKP